ncbi:hypothetical protein [Pseudomonas promysalinigenes]|uniref:hypothetical protein n=1 Tax=Pseudomonas promysalinigenes TaxID=485898 RepID=UPI0016443CBF|nr:hypothetical protein [Pseudomonas promysalinigenes]QXI32133.1 hypothetical protein HU725_013860 [Pseudomonas promysalinigenes]
MEKIKKGLVRIVGKVSSIQSSVHTTGSLRTGALTGNVTGSISSSDQFTFRLNNTPTAFKHENGVSLQEGDEVVVVGRVKNGQLEGYALKNISTGASYDHVNSFAYWCLLAFLPVSIGLIAIAIGLILTPIVILLINTLHKMKYAASMVESYQSQGTS